MNTITAALSPAVLYHRTLGGHVSLHACPPFLSFTYPSAHVTPCRDAGGRIVVFNAIRSLEFWGYPARRWLAETSATRQITWGDQ